MTDGVDHNELLKLLDEIYKKNHGTAIVNHIVSLLFNIEERPGKSPTNHEIYCRFKIVKDNMERVIEKCKEGSCDFPTFLEKLESKVSNEYSNVRLKIQSLNAIKRIYGIHKCQNRSTETT